MRPPYQSIFSSGLGHEVTTLWRATVQLDCNGKKHWVVHTSRGRLRLVHHSAAEGRSWLAATALGATPCACVAVLMQWRRASAIDAQIVEVGRLPYALSSLTYGCRERHRCRDMERHVYEQSFAERLALHMHMEKTCTCDVTRRLRRARRRALDICWSGAGIDGAGPDECVACVRALLADKYGVGCKEHILSPAVHEP